MDDERKADMRKRLPGTLLLALLVLLLGTLIGACQKEEAGPAEPGAPALDGKALAEERCSACHGWDRVTSAEKSADEWKANVERMVAKGAELNAAEQQAVIDYLAEAFPK